MKAHLVVAQVMRREFMIKRQVVRFLAPCGVLLAVLAEDANSEPWRSLGPRWVEQWR
jgi:hypothetical protein